MQSKLKIHNDLFNLLGETLVSEGIVTKESSMIDATFAEVSIQRNSRAENKETREANTTEEWLGDDGKSKHKLAQKDVDARWTKKNNQNYFGYKNHVKVDKDSELIVTPANVHDSQTMQ